MSLLQYVHDTKFFGEIDQRNVFTIKTILRLFELVLSLKVNFHKNNFGAIGVEERIVDHFANIINCKPL